MLGACQVKPVAADLPLTQEFTKYGLNKVGKTQKSFIKFCVNLWLSFGYLANLVIICFILATT